jgi:hypothetical protein
MGKAKVRGPRHDAGARTARRGRREARRAGRAAARRRRRRFAPGRTATAGRAGRAPRLPRPRAHHPPARVPQPAKHTAAEIKVGRSPGGAAP